MYKLKNLGLFIFLCLPLMACATHQPTRQEALDLRRYYDITRTRFYGGKTHHEVLSAVSDLFTLADVDYFVTQTENGCMAYRNWSVFLVIAVMMGKDYWYITTEEVNNGTKITIREVTQSTGYAGTPTGGGGASVVTMPSMINPDFIEYDEMQKQPPLYSLFFKRLDYLLKYGDAQWIDCISALESIRGNVDPLCAVATDKLPAGAPEPPPRRSNHKMK